MYSEGQRNKPSANKTFHNGFFLIEIVVPGFCVGSPIGMLFPLKKVVNCVIELLEKTSNYK